MTNKNMDFELIKNFIDIKDLKLIKKDIEDNFYNNIHKDNLESGLQTKPNLHLLHTDTHWKNFYNKLNDKIFSFNDKKITKSWCLKITNKQKNFFHKHEPNSITSVFFLQNENYFLGTHFKDSNSNKEFIIPGYENSLLIFNGNILHDAVFPNYKLEKPRYTIITDYEN